MNITSIKKIILNTAIITTAFAPIAWFTWAVFPNIAAGFGGKNTFTQRTVILVTIPVTLWIICMILTVQEDLIVTKSKHQIRKEK